MFQGALRTGWIFHFGKVGSSMPGEITASSAAAGEAVLLPRTSQGPTQDLLKYSNINLSYKFRSQRFAELRAV